jgi:ribosome-binding protein aMBF1 (putative translation factor)
MSETRSRVRLRDLADELEEALGDADLSQRDLAARLDVTPRHLRRARKGGYPEMAARALRELGYEVQLYAEVEAP